MNKEKTQKRKLVVGTIFSVLYGGMFVIYCFVFLIMSIRFLNIPSADFTPKDSFLGFFTLFLLFKTGEYLIQATIGSIKFTKKIYGEIKEDK